MNFLDQKHALDSLISALAAERSALLAVVNKINEATLVLVNAQAMLVLPAADDAEPSVRRLHQRYARKPTGEAPTQPSAILAQPLDRPSASLPGKRAFGKRFCSICRKPGHRSKNCPTRR